MKRVRICLGLAIFLAWLAGLHPETLNAGPLLTVPTASRSGALAEGETASDPHYACGPNHTCVEVAGCDVNVDCSSCTCSSEEETGCVTDPRGGEWDAETCTCNYPRCKNENRQHCVDDWGTWLEESCTCDNPCAASYNWELGDTEIISYGWCSDCCQYTTVSYAIYHYYQFCQDHERYLDSYTEESEPSEQTDQCGGWWDEWCCGGECGRCDFCELWGAWWCWRD